MFYYADLFVTTQIGYYFSIIMYYAKIIFPLVPLYFDVKFIIKISCMGQFFQLEYVQSQMRKGVLQYTSSGCSFVFKSFVFPRFIS